MGTSKKELCAGSIYYLCLILNVNVVNLKDESINKIFDSLCKLDYDSIYTLFNDLESTYKFSRVNN